MSTSKSPSIVRWVYSLKHNQLCQIIETNTLWDKTTCRVWLPNQDTVVRVRADQLQNLSERTSKSPEDISYIASAARVADALTQDVLLAPIESTVIPLPHQIRALAKATANDRIRFLLADEVGLGKTIEAGLIMRELKLRGLVKRILVVVPKSLATQWVSEMRSHFNEDFQLVLPGNLKGFVKIQSLQNSHEATALGSELSTRNFSNPWTCFHQVVCPMDSIKPLEKRRGWSQDKVTQYNRIRFDDLLSAGWDMVVIDEAHRMGGSTEQVARFKLGKGLAEASPYLLLLSATPHQGKTDAFHRILSLLDSDNFPDIESVKKERVQPYVIRTEKRQAINADGKALFMPRKTELLSISWGTQHRQQELLYKAVSEYIRKGYNQAILEKRNYVGFLMILMQRLVTSSTKAIQTTLKRRLEALENSYEEFFSQHTQDGCSTFSIQTEEWEDLDGQEQLENIFKIHIKALKNEHAEVKKLLESAISCEESGIDAKAQALLKQIYKLQQEESSPELKVLIFTEFVPTQEMLRIFLTERGFSVVCLNGSMSMDDRERVQEDFAGEFRVLISTDAGGEGLNLQFCHVVINYDIPWNPMRIEQRIGRVDRIGQKHIVRAINFILEKTVEHRVCQVLEAKLAIIQKEFGIDKTGDILDSAQAGEIFEDLYIESILNPEELDSKVESVVNQIHEQAKAERSNVSIFESSEDLNPADAKQIMTHPLPHWVEHMAINYIKANGGKTIKNKHSWEITWPDGQKITKAVFTPKDADTEPSARYLTLENIKIRGLVMNLPRFISEQPIPTVFLHSLPANIVGFWSLWRISIHTEEWNRQRFMPLFIHDDGRCLIPTAKRVWELLLTESLQINGYTENGTKVFDKSHKTAEIQGRNIYEKLLEEHKTRLSKEQEKGDYAFSARKRAIQRIGLPEVREFRLKNLAKEEANWRTNMKKKTQIMPELLPILLIRFDGNKK